MTTLTEAELDRLENCLNQCLPWSDTSSRKLLALARKGLAVQWQPIATAPKDGTRILWCADNGEFTRQRWSYSVIRWPEYEECFESGWWLPLPPSPNCERKDDDAATRQQIDVDRGSERRGNERLHPGDTGGSDTVAVSTDVRPVGE